MIKQKFLFTQDHKSKTRFFSTNRTSTDALNALSSWASKNCNWSYEEIEDRDDEGLVAVLTIPEEDINSAGVALHEFCIEFGLIRSADFVLAEKS